QSFDVMSPAQNGGNKFLALGFIDAELSNNQPAWDGHTDLPLGSGFDTQIRGQVRALRDHGGDVIVSFGGDVQDGSEEKELARVVDNPSDLQAAYQRVIDAYSDDQFSLTRLDFDLEGRTLTNPATGDIDTASIDRRSIAIAHLQHDTPAGANLRV